MFSSKALLVALGTLLAAGCTRADTPAPSPIVAPDVSGHTALIIDHVGAYDLTSVLPNFGLTSGQLSISPSISCYATWHTEEVGRREPVGNPDLVLLHATLVIDAVRHPILVGYTLGWKRLGLPVIAIGATDQPAAPPPFPCPLAK